MSKDYLYSGAENITLDYTIDLDNVDNITLIIDKEHIKLDKKRIYEFLKGFKLTKE